MERSVNIHWLAPTSIIFGLLGGVLTALGHHFYYDSLSGTSAEGDMTAVGYQISNQQFTSAAGTALAFTVRALRLFSVSIAYIQVLWRAARQSRESNTLNEIDAMFSILTNLFALWRASVWCKFPMLLLIALIGW